MRQRLLLPELGETEMYLPVPDKSNIVYLCQVKVTCVHVPGQTEVCLPVSGEGNVCTCARSD